jgi:hypothetical protein
MAITLDFVWRGVTIKGAYVRIDHISGGKREDRMTPDQSGVGVWKGQIGVYADDKQAVSVLTMGVVVPFTVDVSPLVPLYAELKKMPEFSGATDC